jgi:hypothetical protein
MDLLLLLADAVADAAEDLNERIPDRVNRDAYFEIDPRILRELIEATEAYREARAISRKP